MKPFALIIIIVVAIIVIVLGLFFLIKFLQKKQQQSDVLSLPSWVKMPVFEEYLIKNFRIRNIVIQKPVPDFQVPILMIPKFSTDYFKSIYYDISDLKENALAIMYLTQIGNINLSSRMINSVIYLMISRGWDPAPLTSEERIASFTGLARFYNVNIVSSTGAVAIKQYYSDIGSIYLYMSMIKFLLTYDPETPNPDPRLKVPAKAVGLITSAAYDLWNFIYLKQRCAGELGYFFSFLPQKGLQVQLTSSFHIVMKASLNFVTELCKRYRLAPAPNIIPDIEKICYNFLQAAMEKNFRAAPPPNTPTDVITWVFADCSLTPPGPDSSANWDLSATEDYLDLILSKYVPVPRATINVLLDKVLDSFYSPDSGASIVGCGPGIYNAECVDPEHPAQDCYNIACSAGTIPQKSIVFGVRASTEGKGIVFGLSALTLFTATLHLDEVDRTSNLQELNNLKNSLLKIYSQYGTSGILGGFQEELAFPVDPLNTGLQESMFRYPSLMATIYTAYAFSFLKFRNKNYNFMEVNTGINNITLSTLGFNNAEIYRFL